MALVLNKPVACVPSFISHCDVQVGEDLNDQSVSSNEKSGLSRELGSQLKSEDCNDSSDDDLMVSLKASRNRRKIINNLSSDNSDEEKNGISSQSSNITTAAMINSARDRRLLSSSSNSGSSDLETPELKTKRETKILKKRRKIKSNQSDSDNDRPLKNVINMPRQKRKRNRRIHEIGNGSNAMQELKKQRQKLKDKKNSESTMEGNSRINKHTSSDLHCIKVESGSQSNLEHNSKEICNDGGKFEGQTENVEDKSYSESENSEENDNDMELSAERKVYGTRSKIDTDQMAELKDDDELNQETLKLLDNKDLYDAESSDTDNENEENNHEDEREQSDKKMAKEKKSRKLKRITKSEKLKTQSEQQKLQRDVSQIHIPYHEPTQVSINDFLGRVPKLDQLQKKKFRKVVEKDHSSTLPEKFFRQMPSGSSKNPANLNNDVPVKNLARQKWFLPNVPKLSEFSIENGTSSKVSKKPALDAFLQRLERHTAPSMKQKGIDKANKDNGNNKEQNTNPEDNKAALDLKKLEKAPPIPGSRLMLLKSQLQSKMRIQREENRKEAFVRQKMENEEFSEDEECFDGEDGDDQSVDNDNTTDEDESKINSIKSCTQKNLNYNGKNDAVANEDDDEDDDELDKWNTEEKKKQIETQINELDELERTLDNAVKEEQNHKSVCHFMDENTVNSARTAGSSLDLFPGVNDASSVDANEALPEINLHLTENTQWEESNTIPPGQGDAFLSSAKSHLDASTPFSKLLRNGLFGTQRRYSDDHSNAEFENVHERSDSRVDSDESARVGPIISDDLHFSLDENTQYSQILDTQGYFHCGSKKKKQTKLSRLFDEDDGNTVSQLLGLCSGNFEEKKSGTLSALNADDFGLPSDLPCDKEPEVENTQDILLLCSGNFIDASSSKTKEDQQRDDLKLSNKKNIDTFDNLTNELPFEVSSTTEKEHNISLSAFEESKSTSSLMHFFGKSDAAPAEGKKSFENLFKHGEKSNQSTKNNKSSSTEKMGMKTNDDDMKIETDNQKQDKIFYIGNRDTVEDSEDCPESAKAEDDEDSNIGENALDGTAYCDAKSIKIQNQLDDCEDSDEDLDDGEVDEELLEYHESLKAEKKFSKRNFYEEEAELSGSDVGEDDEELGSEADEYEEESDVENLPSEKKLKAQVHRAHMKAVLEDDKQKIRYIQERFYEDGDLLSDGAGRRRNFRWRNIDKLQGPNLAESDGSDNEVHGDEAEVESQREVNKRIQRFEREAFLEDQRQNSQEDPFLDESSQTILNIIKEKNKDKTSDLDAKIGLSLSQAIKLKRSGSFLERSKSTLTRLSSITANDKKANAPSRGFVFQAKSVSSTQDSNDAPKKIRRTLSDSDPPPAKKVKFERTLSNHNEQSIFQLF